MNYGGDEVQALVLDIGTDTTRAGYAGDDAPKAVFSTSYGFTVHPPAEGETGDDKSMPTKLYIGENGPSIWRPRMEVSNPFTNGLISDFAPIPAIVSHALIHSLRTNPAEHPVLVTEPAWNTPANRERMAEILFEEFQVPAFYIANTGVLNAFAAGKGTALVVDIGRNTASVLPVVDGFVLRKGVTQSALPMLLHANAHHMLTKPTPTRLGIDLLPHQLVSQKQPVDVNAPPNYVPRQDRVSYTTDSWKLWAEAREVDEWVSGVAGVLEQGWSEQHALTKHPRPYEFPTGYHTVFGPERFLPGEIYFNHAHLAASNPTLPKTLPTLVQTALANCEPDLRTPLLSNIVLTGGGSLLQGTAERLNNELIRSFGPKVKLHAGGNIIERRFGAWIGGSILASLGTFHQLWISAEEWQEHGRAIVGQRCK
ncbi:actin-related protein Arp4p [Exidia glandulosa HHB12029]|uniref:Actin-related protein Arp4p n=1 Tax=Exidia glandulosa HHB12029 TaxID=1314781 RepID=A0A166BTM7_EXIGL|nr:actin-related protein Arp4p [Exidia glandulosa HHB12029]